MDALTAISTRRTPQSERADPRQSPNHAGGYTFQVGDEARIHRFLTLGTTGGTYYQHEHELTQDNADVVLRVARSRGTWLVERAVEVSTAGRAPKQDQAIFALAVVSALGDDAARKAAFAAMPAVCRTASTLFTFAQYRQQFGGWGRGMSRAVGDWYLSKETNDLAYQMVKYRKRQDWTHRDLLRRGHPLKYGGETDAPRRGLLNWAVNGNVENSRAPGGEQRAVGASREELPALVDAFEQAQATTSVDKWVALVAAHPMSWEMLPDAALSEPRVWTAMIEKGMPQTALMRQLPRLTRLGVLEGDIRRQVVAQLPDASRLRKGRVHPVNVLIAARTYSSGRSMMGSSTWTPNRHIIDALDSAFYNAFQTIEPAGKRTLLALDVSSSMGSAAGAPKRTGHGRNQMMQGILPISCREVSAALALVTLATEPEVDVIGFTGGGGYWGRQALDLNNVSELALSPRQRLDDAIQAIANLPFGGTDCALPMLWADAKRKLYDTFVVMTDNETWAGSVHPHQALIGYRQHTGIAARQVVVGLTATECSIADPDDPLTMDIAGMDSAVPNLIADFSRGSI